MKQATNDLVREDLDPERVAYYRRVRDCLSCLKEDDIRQRLEILHTLAQQIDENLEEFNRLTEDLSRMQVGFTPTTKLGLQFFRLSERPEPWRTPSEPVRYESSREEWSECPSTSDASRAWRTFLIALEGRPARMYRTSIKRLNEWEAEFVRTDGSLMYISLSELKGEIRSGEQVGWFAANSASEIVAQMTTWVREELQDQAHVATRRVF